MTLPRSLGQIFTALLFLIFGFVGVSPVVADVLTEGKDFNLEGSVDNISQFGAVVRIQFSGEQLNGRYVIVKDLKNVAVGDPVSRHVYPTGEIKEGARCYTLSREQPAIEPKPKPKAPEALPVEITGDAVRETAYGVVINVQGGKPAPLNVGEILVLDLKGAVKVGDRVNLTVYRRQGLVYGLPCYVVKPPHR
jgi:hypothetical protein